MSLEWRLGFESKVRKAQFKIAARAGSRRALIKQRDDAELMRLEAEAEVARLNKERGRRQ